MADLDSDYTPKAHGLPRLPKGRPSERAKDQHFSDLTAFAERIIKINSSLGFQVSARGWAYILEGRDEITKGDLDAAQGTINKCRKMGLLPLNICAEDDRRVAEGVEKLHGNIESRLNAWRDSMLQSHEDYTPVSFWDDQDCYVEVLVEKLDLRNLFYQVCTPFRIPITNAGGWADLHSRAAMLRRMFKHWKKGRKIILLCCFDHDPGGLNITDWLRSNLKDMAGATGRQFIEAETRHERIDPNSLRQYNQRIQKIYNRKEEIERMVAQIEIDRFGLNAEDIERLGLLWIDNLETSAGKALDHPGHRDHGKPYVQDYLAQFGARKVEANALVVNPEEGRALCYNAILKYLPEDAPDLYEEQLQPYRDELREELNQRFRLDEEEEEEESDDPEESDEE